MAACGDRIFFFFFFLLWFNVPVNNFSVMLRRSHLFLGITSTFGEETEIKGFFEIQQISLNRYITLGMKTSERCKRRPFVGSLILEVAH